MAKLALFAFNGEAMCFVHVLLNALGLHGQGHDVKVVIEGAACQLAPELAKTGTPLNQLYVQTRDAGLLAGICKACAHKMGTLATAREMDLTILEDMQGHAGMVGFVAAGYDIITI